MVGVDLQFRCLVYGYYVLSKEYFYGNCQKNNEMHVNLAGWKVKRVI